MHACLNYKGGSRSVLSEKLGGGGSVELPPPQGHGTSGRYGTETDVPSPVLVMVKVPEVEEA